MTANAFAQASPSTIREFDIPTIEMLGRAMFDQDRKAAIATDVLFARGGDLNREGVKGWIVDSSTTGAVVRFIREQDGRLEPAYDITIPTGGAPSLTIPQNRNLEPQELSQYAARSLAIQNIDQPCSRQYNTVVLREPKAENWLVWTLAATAQPDVILVGGHYRFTISSDGQRIIAKDRLSRSCITIPRQPPEGQAVGAYVTHIVSATPVEVHVFLSLLHRVPIYVGVADSKVWMADRGSLKQVK